MKQRALWSAAVVVIALALNGCGSAGGSKSPEPGTTGKLLVWDWKSGDKTAASYIVKAKADFAKKHPSVTVEFVAQPFDQYYTLLGAAIQSGQGPDVMLFNGGGQIRDRVASLVALDDWPHSSRWMTTSRLTGAGWPAGTRSPRTARSTPHP
jgi:multiple sugar transport system substrate-binding protein